MTLIDDSVFHCPRCQAIKAVHAGLRPHCAFDVNGVFSDNNWNCATINALRERAELCSVKVGDHSIGLVGHFDVGIAIFKWYKSRGNTLLFLNQDLRPGSLRFAQQLLGDIEPDDPLAD